MTPEQKELIMRLRAKGLSFGKIAATVGLSVNTVKSFCWRNRIDTTPPKYEDSPSIQTAAQISQARYSFVERAIKSAKCKTIVIDDSQYLLADEFFDRAKENGYQKFTDIALNFRNLIHNINNMGEDDKIVYFLHHSEDDGAGREKVKTIGKMLDQNLGGLESMFSVCLMCNTDGNEHWFETQSDGYTPAKSPLGMWDERKIDNDLKAVAERIREYWQIGAANE